MLSALYSVNAATVLVTTSGPGSWNLNTSSDVSVPVGNTYWYGTFDYASWTSVDTSDLATVYTHFTRFGNAQSIGTAGELGGSATATVAGTVYDSKPIYLWAFKTSDNSAVVGNNFSLVAEHGIYSSTNVTTPWNFGSNDLAAITPKLSNVDIFRAGSAGTSAVKLEAVPEPATSLLVALGLTTVMVFRRRNRG